LIVCEGWRIGVWRRGWDSNPRYTLTVYNGLANRRLQPLGHPSGLGVLGPCGGSVKTPNRSADYEASGPLRGRGLGGGFCVFLGASLVGAMSCFVSRPVLFVSACFLGPSPRLKELEGEGCYSVSGKTYPRRYDHMADGSDVQPHDHSGLRLRIAANIDQPKHVTGFRAGGDKTRMTPHREVLSWQN
jgi:hypothetical protein